MREVQILEVARAEKGRVRIRFSDGVTAELYRGEFRRFTHIEQETLVCEGAYVPEELYRKLLEEVVGLRVKKRALFLLERMDHTEQQLCEKLRRNGYPEICIAQAISYVKKYHYIDDLKYARTYVRIGQQKKSRERLRIDLLRKGVKREWIEQALLEEFVSDERAKIQELMEKRRYNAAAADRREQQRMYQFLLRRGYQSGDILAVLRQT